MFSESIVKNTNIQCKNACSKYILVLILSRGVTFSKTVVIKKIFSFNENIVIQIKNTQSVQCKTTF